jgi:amino acid transporter
VGQQTGDRGDQGSAQELDAAAPERTLKREFSFVQGASVGFADISPIVALYGVFALALAAAGPPMFWGVLVVFGAQLLVALVFGEIASRWPIAGGVYQWTRQQLGVRIAWFAGWAYIWTNVIALSAIAYGGASFLAATIAFSNPSTTSLIAIAVGLLCFTTLANMVSQKFLKVFVILSVTAEFVASIVVGAILLIGYRVNSFSTLFDSFGTGSGSFYLTSAFLGALAFVGYSAVGFEATGAIAEEVREPERQVPKAIVLVLGMVGAVVAFASLAFILANPDIKGSLTGDISDPVATTLDYHFGSNVTRPLLGMITLGFVASLLAVQTAVSRVVFSFARDGMIPAARFLRHLTPRNHIPARSVVLVAGIGGLVLLLNSGASKVFQTLISFVTGGFYISFAFPIFAALYLHLVGRHEKGPFSLGRFSFPITLAAALWLVFELINVSWPRYDELPWYQNWAVVIMVGVLGVVGLGVFLFVIRDREGDQTTAPLAQGAALPDDGA